MILSLKTSNDLKSDKLLFSISFYIFSLDITPILLKALKKEH